MRTLFVYWPDFTDPDDPGSSPGAALVAARLRRYIDQSSGTVEVLAYPGDSESAEAFARWEIPLTRSDLIPAGPSAAPAPGDPPPTFAIAASAARVAEIAATLDVAEAAPECLLPGEGPGTLSELLHLRTARPVHLLVDWRSLRGWTSVPAGSSLELVRLLMARAELVGPVTSVRVYGLPPDGKPVQVAGTASVQLPDSLDLVPPEKVDERLFRELQRLEGSSAEVTWILVTESTWVDHLLSRAWASGRRLLLWSPSPERCPVEVRSAADTWMSLDEVFGLVGASGAEGLLQAGGTPPPSGPIPAVSRLNPWIRLAYRIHCLLRAHGWRQIPYRRLIGLLSEDEEFGPTAARAQAWIHRAHAEGLITVTEEEHRIEPGIRIATCRLNPLQIACVAALEVPENCIRLLRQMLQKMPWVSFKLLRNVLIREQWLGGQPYSLDEAATDEWLNFLVRDGALKMSKERNLENPEYPVTALRVNEEHPLVSGMAGPHHDARALLNERLLLAVDHFLERSGKPWMAMAALRRALGNVSREELQQALNGLMDRGALLTESYPNPRKEHATTGCRLNPRHQLLLEARATRDQLLLYVARHRRPGQAEWACWAELEESVMALPPDHAVGAHPRAWLQLLRDEGLVHVHDAAELGAGEGLRYRIVMDDPVVRAVFAASTDPDPGCAEPVGDEQT